MKTTLAISAEGFLNKEWDKYLDYFHRMQVAPKTVLLREGEVSKKAFLIEQGCLRAWFNKDGKDITFQFFFEGSMVSSLESFRENIPSQVTIEAIEPGYVWWINKADFEKMFEAAKNSASINEFFMNSLFGRMFDYMHHFLSFIRDTPAQRYLSLINNHPHIIQRVPQRYIASYLGITTVHLSRIKRKLSKEKHH
jgi:CRP-like cAMP-binding protein